MSHVIAFAGHPGAGKSSVVRGLLQALEGACAVYMDDYETMTRTAIEDIALWAKSGADIDAFSFPRLEADLGQLRAGRAIVEKRTGRQLVPGKYVLFETQFGRAHRATGEHIDLMVWVDTPLDIALARNVRKLAASWLRDPQPEKLAGKLQWMVGYLDNYIGTVRPLMAMQRDKVAGGADIVVDGQPPLADVVQSAKAEILRRLA